MEAGGLLGERCGVLGERRLAVLGLGLGLGLRLGV